MITKINGINFEKYAKLKKVTNKNNSNINFQATSGHTKCTTSNGVKMGIVALLTFLFTTILTACTFNKKNDTQATDTKAVNDTTKTEIKEVKKSNNPQTADIQAVNDTTKTENKDEVKSVRYTLPEGYREPKYVIVQKGDNLWNIAKWDLEQRKDTNITDAKIYERMKELKEINELPYDDSLGFRIYLLPGDIIYLEPLDKATGDFFDE